MRKKKQIEAACNQIESIGDQMSPNESIWVKASHLEVAESVELDQNYKEYTNMNILEELYRNKTNIGVIHCTSRLQILQDMMRLASY